MPWENTLDWIAIGLCLMVIACLVYNRIRRGTLIQCAGSQAISNGFRSEVLARMYQQQTLASLQAVADKIREEQERLLQWTESPPGESPQCDPAESPPAALPADDSDTRSRPAQVGYEAILELLQHGIDENLIADRLGRPRAEIELFSKLCRPQ